jgi:hypothetical protein
VVLADGNTERLDQEDSVEKEREREQADKPGNMQGTSGKDLGMNEK